MPDETVWIKTAPAPDGTTYVVTLEIGEDIAVILDHDRVLSYAYELLRAVATAEHDAAVLAQLEAKGVPTAAVVEMVRTLRKDRPPPNYEATAPLTFVPGVSQATQKGYIQVDIDRLESGQWSLDEARENALAMLEAHASADLDSAYYRGLISPVGLKPEVARIIVDDLANFRPDS